MMNADNQCAISPAGGGRLVHGGTPLCKAHMSVTIGYIAIRRMRIHGASDCCEMPRSQGCSCFDWDFGRLCRSRVSRPSLQWKVSLPAQGTWRARLTLPQERVRSAAAGKQGCTLDQDEHHDQHTHDMKVMAFIKDGVAAHH